MSDAVKSRRLAPYRTLLIAMFLVIIVFGASLAGVCYQAACRRLAAEGLSEEMVRQNSGDLLHTTVVVTTVAIALALAIVSLLVVVTTRPVRTFLASVARVRREESDAGIDLGGVREFEPAAETFVLMAQKRKRSRGQLERQVQQRTTELSAMNKVLASEVVRRMKVQERLEESLSLLEATLEATADGILVTGTTGRIKDFNKRFQDLWRIPDSVLESHSDEEALSWVSSRLRDPAAFLASVREFYDRPDTEDSDVLEFRDGSVIERFSKPQVLGNQVVGRVWSFRDVTDRYLAQRNQAALLRRVTQINEELTHFAYAVSHDLKAPLRGIKLVTEWLCADYGEKLDDEARQQFDLLTARVDRMHNLIDGILQYSRVGRIREKMVTVDLDELIAAVVDAIVPPEHIRIIIEDSLPEVECERTRITQVFQNLLSNAVKFMDKPKGEIRIGCREDGDCWRFHVTDNGPGIEERHFDRIFRIFQTLAPRDEFESTGVGLTLVKKIVEMYGGRVWVESELGHGSTFFFTLSKHHERTVDEKHETCAAGRG